MFVHYDSCRFIIPYEFSSVSTLKFVFFFYHFSSFQFGEVSIQACHLQVEEDRRSFPPGRAVYQHHAEPDEVQGVSNEGEQTVQAEHLLSILRLPETPVQPKGQPHHRRVLRTGPVREGGPGPLVTDSHGGGRPQHRLGSFQIYHVDDSR